MGQYDDHLHPSRETDPNVQTIEPDLDHLVPPFPSKPSRLVRSTVVLGAAVAVAYGALAGWLYPRITVDSSSGSYALDDSGPVRLQVSFNNPGHRSLTVDQALVTTEGVGLPSTIVVWSTSEGGSTVAMDRTLPFTLHPSERATISIDVVPTNCTNGTALIDADAEIHYHFADGPPSVGRSAEVADAFADHTVSCNT